MYVFNSLMRISPYLLLMRPADAGVNISGTNAEVMPAQWEFQVGPCEGITSKLNRQCVSWIVPLTSRSG